MNQFNVVSTIRYSIHRICDPGTWFVSERSIPDHELVFIEGGKGTVVIEGREHQARKGRLFYFYPGLRHSMETDDADPLCFYAFHFDYANVNYTDHQWHIVEGAKPILSQTVLETGNFSFCLDIMEKINEAWNKKLPGYELICASSFSKLFFFLFQNSFEQEVNYYCRHKVEEVIHFIKANVHKQFKVSDLADMAGISPDYLSRCFKNCTGHTLKAYIHMVKIDAAKHMIIDENKRIKEVAQMLGFKDEYYFSRVFKKIEGTSPGSYFKHTMP